VIGETLKRTRNIYGMTASNMSSELGISASYLSEIENGKKQPSLELLEKYSSIYGIKVSSLILLSENIESAKQKKDGSAFIRQLMTNLINGMSDTAGGRGI
jgi:transcriptional regulator with XRE-family HTH domain